MLFKVCYLYAGCSSAVQWIGYLFDRAQVIHSKESVSFANGSGYAFETKLQPFEQLKLSVQKKKKQYLLLACSNGWSYLFKEKF